MGRTAKRQAVSLEGYLPSTSMSGPLLLSGRQALSPRPTRKGPERAEPVVPTVEFAHGPLLLPMRAGCANFFLYNGCRRAMNAEREDAIYDLMIR
jgi:hypothetical protein